MFASEEDTFIGKYLGPAFEKSGITTEIQLYDHNPDVVSYPLSILADPVASKYAIGTAFHLYGGDSGALTEVHNEYPNKNLYLTEQSVTGRPRGTTIDIAEPVSRVLIGATRNWSRNVLLWNLAADPHAGPHTDNGGCTGCFGAITLDGDNATFNVAYYAAAHFSKFVRPGSVRIGSNELEQLHTAAFLTPDGKVVLVVANTGNFSKAFQIGYHGVNCQDHDASGIAPGGNVRLVNSLRKCCESKRSQQNGRSSDAVEIEGRAIGLRLRRCGLLRAGRGTEWAGERIRYGAECTHI